VKHVVVYLFSFRKLRESDGLSVPLEPDVCAHVVGLFFIGSPANVSWFIVSVSVNPVNGVFWGGLRTHECGKRPVASYPCRMYPDAPIAIVTEGWIFFVVTAGLHTPPASIEVAFSLGVGVRRYAHRADSHKLSFSLGSFNSATSAAFCTPMLELVPWYVSSCLAALTYTVPCVANCASLPVW